MKQEDVKKELERSARLTGKDVFIDAYKIITEQEKEIERLKEEKKQAQIDVLNKLKKYLHTEDFDTPDERWKPESEFCAIIDKLIKEIEDDKCNC